jgi:hypothetical protein
LLSSDGQCRAAVAAWVLTQRDGVAAEPPSGPGREQRVAGLSGSFAEPQPQERLGGAGEGDGSVLSSFAFAVDARAGPEPDVLAVQAGEFGDAQAGLDGQQHQVTVSPPFPASLIGRGEQRVDLGGGQERHDPLVAAFGGNREHALDEQCMLGMAQRGVGEQRADRGQPQVPGPGAVAPLVFEMVQERRDGGGVQVVPVEFGGRLAGVLVHEGEQQAHGVAVGGDGLRAGLTLLEEPVGEERLQRRRGKRHDRAARHAVSCRAAASVSSSGAADRYQYVYAGSR